MLQWPCRGLICPGGVSRGVLAGECLPEGLHVWPRGCVSGQGGCTPLRLVDRMADASENITFPQLLLQMVINHCPV